MSTYDDHPDGLVVADARGVVVVFNAAAARITGTSAQAALGKDLADALPLEDLDGRALVALRPTRTTGSAAPRVTRSATCSCPAARRCW